MPRGRIQRWPRVTRADVRDNPNVLFVFGDNMERRGMGGQAKEMRGEPNTIGIPTKWAPRRRVRDYFADVDWDNLLVRHDIDAAFLRIEESLANGLNVVIPLDGIGTGLAELPTRAPAIYAQIVRRIAEFEAGNTGG